MIGYLALRLAPEEWIGPPHAQWLCMTSISNNGPIEAEASQWPRAPMDSGQSTTFELSFSLAQSRCAYHERSRTIDVLPRSHAAPSLFPALERGTEHLLGKVSLLNVG